MNGPWRFTSRVGNKTQVCYVHRVSDDRDRKLQDLLEALILNDGSSHLLSPGIVGLENSHGHFLDDLAFEVFGAVLLIVSSVSVFMTDRLFGKIYPPSRRKAVMQHYAGRKFSPFRRNLFFFPLYLLLIPAMVLLGTALKWITEILK